VVDARKTCRSGRRQVRDSRVGRNHGGDRTRRGKKPDPVSAPRQAVLDRHRVVPPATMMAAGNP